MKHIMQNLSEKFLVEKGVGRVVWLGTQPNQHTWCYLRGLLYMSAGIMMQIMHSVTRHLSYLAECGTTELLYRVTMTCHCTPYNHSCSTVWEGELASY